MDLNELSYQEQMKLVRIYKDCMALKKRLENRYFKVIRFEVKTSLDIIDQNIIEKSNGYINGLQISTTIDSTLPAGTINVAALVQ